MIHPGKWARIRLHQTTWTVMRSMVARELSMTDSVQMRSLTAEQAAGVEQYRRELRFLMSEIDKVGALKGWTHAR